MIMDIPEGFVDISPDEPLKIWKRIVKEGEGSVLPNSGDMVSVHYVGTLFDGERKGEQFDSSRERETLFEFKLGTGMVIKGWDVGVSTMKRGEVCELIAHYDYAYGEMGQPPSIPEKASLLFEVELFHWIDETDWTENKDGGIICKYINKEEDMKSANAEIGDNVIFDYKICLKNDESRVVVDKKKVSYDIEDKECELINAIKIALLKMNVNEEIRLTISSKYGFSQDILNAENLPFDSIMICYLHLHEINKYSSSFEYSDKVELVSTSQMLKEKGTKFLKQENLNTSLIWYKKAFKYITVYNDGIKENESDDDNKEMPLNDALKKSNNQLYVAICLNLSLVNLKLNNFQDCFKNCNLVLDIDESNEKALFRIAQCYFESHEYTNAIEYFQKVCHINESNTGAKNYINLCLKKQFEEKENERKMCQNMFKGIRT